MEEGVSNPLGNILVDDIPIDIVDDVAEEQDKTQFRDQTVETIDVELLKNPSHTAAAPIFFFPLTIPQRKAACKVFGIKYKKDVFPKNRNSGKQLSPGDQAPDSYVEIPGLGHCYYHTISYVISGDKYSHITLRQKINEYVEDPENWYKLRSYIPPEFKSGKEYTKARHMHGLGWASEVELFATAQMINHDIISFSSYGKWERYVRSGNSEDTTKNCIYITNEKGDHFEPVTRV
jgi:hypothetical protein